MPEVDQATVRMTDFTAIFRIVVTRFFGIAFWPLRVLLNGIRHMRETLGFLIFFSVGVLIAAAALWYVTTVVNWWRANSGPPSLGTVRVLGLQDAQAKALADALPSMILSELRRLGERTNQAKRQLQELERTPNQQTLPQDRLFQAVPVPEGLKTEVAIPQQIAGVDIGWALTWIKDLLATANVIDLTVSYGADGKKATLFGHAKGTPGYAFYVHDEGGLPDEIAQAAAAAIIQNEQRRDEIAVQSLPTAKYLPVVDALSAYATYERVVRSYTERERPDFTAEYGVQLQTIGPIADSYAQWGELQWLAAEIAERAGDRAKALSFTQNEQRITPRDDQRYPRLAARLKRLNEATIAAASPPDKLKSSREKAGQLIDEASASPFRMLMHVPSPVPDHKNIRISYVGAPWPEVLTTVKHAPFFGSADHQTEEISDYITRVLQVSRIVAPDALYQFTGLDEGLTTKSLLEGLDAIAGAGTDVLIFTYATRGQLPFLTTLRGLSEKMIVILAAGNDGGQSAYASVDDVALVVGAADSDGQLMSFSDKSERSVSAPGAKIPITSPATGEVSPSNGSSFSAAFAGAAAALLKAKFPTATPKQVVSALRDTAKGPARSIDVTVALQKLGEALQAAGANH